VDTPDACAAAADIIARIAPGTRVDNNLTVETYIPQDVAEFNAQEPSHLRPPESVAEIRDEDGNIEPDFTDQALDTTGIEDFAEPYELDQQTVGVLDETENVGFPPTDPVVTTDQHGNTQVLGGFEATSMDTQPVGPSALDRVPGDEALADAVRRELREDATTTALEIDVVVRQGIVHLRGSVPGIEDADNAEDVAGRVPGIVEVREELQVREL
jgi:osmotically-inducible protein OsmY